MPQEKKTKNNKSFYREVRREASGGLLQPQPSLLCSCQAPRHLLDAGCMRAGGCMLSQVQVRQSRELRGRCDVLPRKANSMPSERGRGSPLPVLPARRPRPPFPSPASSSISSSSSKSRPSCWGNSHRRTRQHPHPCPLRRRAHTNPTPTPLHLTPTTQGSPHSPSLTPPKHLTGFWPLGAA